jgi:quercetin dioxygenase-like cupin family protein
MATPVHAPRRSPTEAHGPLDLGVTAKELLAEAGELRAQRSARTLTPGAGAGLKQSLLALKAGERLKDHVAPGPTTLLGVTGTAMLDSEEGEVTLSEGVWVVCPTGPHSLEATTDAVVLLTVTPGAAGTAERD